MQIPLKDQQNNLVPQAIQPSKVWALMEAEDGKRDKM